MTLSFTAHDVDKIRTRTITKITIHMSIIPIIYTTIIEQKKMCMILVECSFFVLIHFCLHGLSIKRGGGGVQFIIRCLKENVEDKSKDNNVIVTSSTCHLSTSRVRSVNVRQRISPITVGF